MKKTLFRFFAVVLSVVVFGAEFGLTVNAKIPSPSRYFYVYDEANVLTLSTEDHIITANEELASKCGAQIVIACVETTGNTEIADYTYKLFNKWEIGDKEKKNGVLVVLAINDGDYYALQGRGLENLLSAGTLKLMLDQYLEPYFSSADYDTGVREVFDELVTFVSEIYSVTVNVRPTEPQAPYSEMTTQSVDQWILEGFNEHSTFNNGFDPFDAAEQFLDDFSLSDIIGNVIRKISFSKIIIFIVVIVLISSMIKKKKSKN